MGRQLVHRLASVVINPVLSIDIQGLIRINRDNHISNESLLKKKEIEVRIEVKLIIWGPT